MQESDSVTLWLRDLPDYQLEGSPPPSTGAEKRKAIHLISPPHSVEQDDMLQSTPKKRRITNNAFDPDLTPRARANGPESTSTPSDTSSGVSRVSTSSPKKQLMNLRLEESGVEIRSLDPDRPPSAGAADLLKSIKSIGRTMKILPHTVKSSTADSLRARKLAVDEWEHAFRSADDEEQLPGRLPSFEEVEHIHIEAVECQEEGHDESCWNHQVHLRLLESICKVGPRRCDAFGVVGCTSARPHSWFKCNAAPAKMVDACIYAAPCVPGEAWNARMKRFARLSPTLTVNHTDYMGLTFRPLLLSIETKKHGIDGDRAELQMGTWHSSQWAFLHWAVARKLASLPRQSFDAQDETGSEDSNEGETGAGSDGGGGVVDMGKTNKAGQPARKLTKEEEMCAAALSTLGFLPGIIVQGHRWALILSTYDSITRRTQLWTEHHFGTTQGLLETYATVAGVRRLMVWARDVYLPWLREHVMD